jgi:phosphate transport system substrate-binding protein
VSIYAEGGGTEKGVEALIHGKTDICAASRPLRSEEVKSLAEKYKNLGMRFLIAKDALSIYVHPENPIQNFSLDQVRKIFKGEITNWTQIGGPDKPICVLIRPPTSGTYLYFKEHILEGEAYGKNANSLATTSSLVQAIKENPAAIGYGGIAYGSDIRHCSINDVEPTTDTVRNDSYPIIRYLFLYTTNTPRDETKSFIDWVLKDGQKIVREVGYVPLWEH